MRTCPECGRHNAPGTQFCTYCQAFLEWEEDAGDAPGGADTARGRTDSGAGAAPQRPAPSWSREPEESGHGGTAPQPADPPAQAPPAAAPGPAPARPSPASGPTPQPGPRIPPVPQNPPRIPAQPSQAPAAAAHDAPPATAAPRRPGDDPLTDTGGPEPHEEPVPAATPPPPDAAPSAPARRCPRCRKPSPAERRLCTHCGALLDPASEPAAQAPVRGSWWQRIFGRRDERRMEAGTRPRRRVLPRPRLALPLVLLLLGVLAFLGRTQLAELYDYARDRTGKPEALRPVTSRASSEARGHKAAAAFDGVNNRYWAPAKKGAGTGQYVEVDFGEPVRLRKLLITPGSSARQNEYLKQARPAQVTVTLVTASGDRSAKPLNLRDQAGGQTFDVLGTDIARVRVTTDEAYGAGPERRLAIAELEFFGRR